QPVTTQIPLEARCLPRPQIQIVFAEHRDIGLLSPFFFLLLVACRPADIAGFVVPAVIDPIDGMLSRRPRSDMRIECLERVAPFVGDLNAPTAVVVIAAERWRVAARLHVCPSSILRRHAAGPSVPAFVPLSAVFRDGVALRSYKRCLSYKCIPTRPVNRAQGKSQ